MKKISVLTISLILAVSFLKGQEYRKITNPAYKYVSSPGFINITELNAAIGISDSLASDNKYYFGITSLFGYQINRNFSGGVGTGIIRYESRQLIPLYLGYRYSIYLKGATPYFYADAGVLFDYRDFKNESKVFINPGVGISRYITSRFEASMSAGFMLQTRTSIRRIGYINFRLGVIFRKNEYRLFRPNPPAVID